MHGIQGQRIWQAHLLVAGGLNQHCLLVKVEGRGCTSMCGINEGDINCEGRGWVTVRLDVCGGQQVVVG